MGDRRSSKYVGVVMRGEYRASRPDRVALVSRSPHMASNPALCATAVLAYTATPFEVAGTLQCCKGCAWPPLQRRSRHAGKRIAGGRNPRCAGGRALCRAIADLQAGRSGLRTRPRLGRCTAGRDRLCFGQCLGCRRSGRLRIPDVLDQPRRPAGRIRYRAPRNDHPQPRRSRRRPDLAQGRMAARSRAC